MKYTLSKPRGRMAYTFALSVAACFLLLLPGCSNPLAPQGAAENETGSLALTLHSGAERTIMPSTVLGDFAQFRLEFTSGGDTIHRILNAADLVGNIATVGDLPAGVWNLRITAFLANGDANNPQTAVAEGNSASTVSVVAGQATQVTVQLLPISTGGQGTFAWNITFPSDVHTATVEIRRADGTEEHSSTFTSAAGGTSWGASHALSPGQYIVVFTLSKDGGTAVITEALHIYRNMYSRFEGARATFTELDFPVSLLATMAGTWNAATSSWDLYDAGVRARHFEILDIDGVTNANFADIAYWFARISPATFPANGGELKALTDAALIGIRSQDSAFTFLGNYTGQTEKETAIRNLVINTNRADVGFSWDGNLATVNVGGYTVQVQFSASLTWLFNFDTALAAGLSQNTPGTASTLPADTGNWFNLPVHAETYWGMGLFLVDNGTDIPREIRPFQASGGIVGTFQAIGTRPLWGRIHGITGPFTLEIAFSSTGGNQTDRFPSVRLGSTVTRFPHYTNGTALVTSTLSLVGDGNPIELLQNNILRMYRITLTPNGTFTPPRRPLLDIDVHHQDLINGNLELEMGSTTQLGVSFNPLNTTDSRAVNWSSSNPGVVAVDVPEAGVIRAVSAGHAIITATPAAGDVFSTSITVNVPAPPVGGFPVREINILGEHWVFDINGANTRMLEVDVLPALAANRDLAWQSSDPNVVTVVDGELTRRGPGTATITASALDGSGVTGYTTVSVYDSDDFTYFWTAIGSGEYNFPSNGVSHEINDMNWTRMGGGGGTQNIGSAGADFTNMTWALGIVDLSGTTTTSVGTHVSGVFDFTVPMVLYIDYHSAFGQNFQVRVNNTSHNAGDSIHQGQSLVRNGGMPATQGTIVVPILPSMFNTGGEHLADSTLTLRSDGNHSMRVTGIRLRENDNVLVTEAQITEWSYNIDVGDSVQFHANVLPLEATDQSLSWSSNNETVATVDQQGVVTARAVGQALIVVESVQNPDAQDSVQITVHEPYTPVVSVSIDGPDERSMILGGGTMPLAATVLPLYATNPNLHWRSDDEAVATVNQQGVVTAVGEGETSINVQSESNPDAYDEVLVRVSGPTQMPYLWNFGPGTIPGWEDQGNSSTASTTSPGNRTTATLSNNMTLFGGIHNNGIGWGSIVRNAADASLGRIQTAGAINNFMEIADVSGPFVITVRYTSTAAAGDPRRAGISINGGATIWDEVGVENQTYLRSFRHTFTGTGLATIRVSAGAALRFYEVELEILVAPLQSIQITGDTLVGGSFELNQNSTAQLDVVFYPANTTDSLGITWSSSNTAVAEVNSDGLVTGIRPGTAIITATSYVDGVLPASVNVTVPLTPQALFEALRGQRVQTGGWADYANGGLGVSYANATTLTLITPETHPNPIARRMAFTSAISGNGQAFVIVSGDIDLSDGRLTDAPGPVDGVTWDPNNPTSNARINDRRFNIGSNTTIIGMDNARIMFGGLRINNSNNVIIRNVTLWDARCTRLDAQGQLDPGLDQLLIDGGSTGVWLDHVRFTSGLNDHRDGGDWHDTLLNVTYGQTTVSWSEFTNANEVLLVGGNDNALIQEQRRVTLHHNFFHTARDRMPRTRGTQMHIYNNYFTRVGNYVMGPGRNAHFVVQNNLFEAPIHIARVIHWGFNNSGAVVWHSGNEGLPLNPASLTGGGSPAPVLTTDPSLKPWEPSDFYDYTLNTNVQGLRDLIPARAGPTLETLSDFTANMR